MTDAVTISLEQRLATERRRRRQVTLGDIAERLAALPVLDDRAVDDILGDDYDGLPS